MRAGPRATRRADPGGIDAGYDHIHVYQVGPDQEGFFRSFEREVLPAFR
jgi:hypothetical protein